MKGKVTPLHSWLSSIFRGVCVIYQILRRAPQNMNFLDFVGKISDEWLSILPCSQSTRSPFWFDLNLGKIGQIASFLDWLDHFTFLTFEKFIKTWFLFSDGVLADVRIPRARLPLRFPEVDHGDLERPLPDWNVYGTGIDPLAWRDSSIYEQVWSPM